MPLTVAWFHCFAGIAGDMALGSLIDAGADVDALRAMLKLLPLDGWTLEVEPVQRGGIAATKVHVGATDDGSVRTYSNIYGLIESAGLPMRVRDRAQMTFATLAEAEGGLHRRSPEQVHFHEVGGIDAIVDVVGTCAALELLGVDEVRASPVAVGLGMFRAAHGALPNPAPAVVDLLRGADVYGRRVAAELTTPTGAALLAAMATGYGPVPAITISSSGFGAGDQDFATLPNLTQVVIGTLRDTTLEPGQPTVLIETNVDDATGEVLAYAVAALLEAGAHDAWITPIIMKKGRPAFTVSVLVDLAASHHVCDVLKRETGSLGVRGQRIERWPARRNDGEVQVGSMPVRIKTGSDRIKVEYDDAVRVARHTKTPLRQVMSMAEEAWRAGLGSGKHHHDDR